MEVMELLSHSMLDGGKEASHNSSIFGRFRVQPHRIPRSRILLSSTRTRASPHAARNPHYRNIIGRATTRAGRTQ